MHIGFWWLKLQERDHCGKEGRSWKDDIKMVLKELQWDNVDWTHLAQDWEMQ